MVRFTHVLAHLCVHVPAREYTSAQRSVHTSFRQANGHVHRHVCAIIVGTYGGMHIGMRIVCISICLDVCMTCIKTCMHVFIRMSHQWTPYMRVCMCRHVNGRMYAWD